MNVPSPPNWLQLSFGEILKVTTNAPDEVWIQGSIDCKTPELAQYILALQDEVIRLRTRWAEDQCNKASSTIHSKF